MLDLESQSSFKTIRLIIAALALGMIAFGAMVVFMITGGVLSTDPALANILLLALLGLAFAEAAAYVVLRAVFLKRVREEWTGAVADETSVPGVLGAFVTLSLIGAAMAEGIGLFGTVILMLTGAWLAIIAPAAALIVIAFLFPTHGKFTSFASNVTGRHWG